MGLHVEPQLLGARDIAVNKTKNLLSEICIKDNGFVKQNKIFIRLADDSSYGKKKNKQRRVVNDGYCC